MSRILGLGGGYYHDSSACLVEHGRVVAFAEEERFNRRKQNTDSLSCARSAAYCLKSAGLSLGDVDVVAVAWNKAWPRDLTSEDLESVIPQLLEPQYFHYESPRSVVAIDHHLAHAASAFYCSGFEEAGIMVVDGSGDGISTSIARGTAGGIERFVEIPFSQSLGWLYESVAEYLGLGHWTGAGKLMGLAAYGRATIELPIVKSTSTGYQIDLSDYGVEPDPDPRTYSNLEFYGNMKHAVFACLEDIGIDQPRSMVSYEHQRGQWVRTLDLGPDHRNLAASVQRVLQECLLSIARVAVDMGGPNLCCAGGVALNCTANGVLMRSSGAAAMFVQPIAGDAGTAIGAALEVALRAGELTLPGVPMTSTAFGPEFSDADVSLVLSELGTKYERISHKVAERAADLIAQGRVVGWFDGPAEGGPRALGHRSILGDPRSIAIRDHINSHVKKRELWRPLAPSLLQRTASHLIPDCDDADFMNVAYYASEAGAALIPGAVHVDGSVRPQVLREGDNGQFACLLEAFESLTGIGAVINTSFNDDTEPIVLTPRDALRTFASTPIDDLVINDFLISKSR